MILFDLIPGARWTGWIGQMTATIVQDNLHGLILQKKSWVSYCFQRFWSDILSDVLDSQLECLWL